MQNRAALQPGMAVRSRSPPSGLLAMDGEKLQVKARVVSDPPLPGQLQLSPFRSFGFDSAVIVLLSAADYAIARASKVPRHVVESAAVYRQHVNGKVLFARPEIMGHTDATDLTATLRDRYPELGHSGFGSRSAPGQGQLRQAGLGGRGAGSAPSRTGRGTHALSSRSLRSRWRFSSPLPRAAAGMPASGSGWSPSGPTGRSARTPRAC